VVANSRAGLRAYHQNGKKGRYVLYNGFNDDRIPRRSKDELRQELGLDDKFTVTMIASMGDSKDQKTFIKAAAKVFETINDVQIFLIGDGPKKAEYVALVSSLGLEKGIFFTGEVNNVEEYLKASDLSVLMSTNAEGFPNVVLESLACRTPVVANDNGGTRELLINGKNGYLVRPGDHEMLASKIRFMNENKNVLHRLAENGAYRVRVKFGVNKMISNFENILSNSIV
jgi:glycosyltransferase involved in cell wall biosynthesis